MFLIRSSKGASFVVILIVGLLIGLLVAGAAAFLYSKKTTQKQATPQTENKGILLSVTSPVNGTTISESSPTIKGTTGKDSVVVITGGESNIVTESESGNFTARVTLSEGKNDLSVYAFDPQTGESAQTSISLLYLKDEFGSANVLVAADNTIENLKERISTQSSELKKAATSFKRTFVSGTIIGIAGTALTIQTEIGNIKTAFTDDFTNFLAIDNKSKATTKLEDLKAGDKIAVIGLDQEDTNGNGKFVVQLKTTRTNNHAIIGKVKETDGNSITLSHLSLEDKEYSLMVGTGANIEIKNQEKIGTVNDIQVNDVLVAVGTVDKKGILTAGKIFVVPTTRKVSTTNNSTQSATPSSTR